VEQPPDVALRRLHTRRTIINDQHQHADDLTQLEQLHELVDNVIATADNAARAIIEHLDECADDCPHDHDRLRAALEHCRAIQHDAATLVDDVAAELNAGTAGAGGAVGAERLRHPMRGSGDDPLEQA
jgi:hypothetical protein